MTYSKDNKQVPRTSVPPVPSTAVADGSNAVEGAPSDNSFSRVGNKWTQMIYGRSETIISNQVETRIQRLERGQKVSRRGRVVLSVPQFRTQTVVSQTTSNNPFSKNTIGGTSYPAGAVPDSVAPVTTNSRIRYPRTVDQP